MGSRVISLGFRTHGFSHQARAQSRVLCIPLANGSWNLVLTGFGTKVDLRFLYVILHQKLFHKSMLLHGLRCQRVSQTLAITMSLWTWFPKLGPMRFSTKGFHYVCFITFLTLQRFQNCSPCTSTETRDARSSFVPHIVQSISLGLICSPNALPDTARISSIALPYPVVNSRFLLILLPVCDSRLMLHKICLACVCCTKYSKGAQ